MLVFSNSWWVVNITGRSTLNLLQWGMTVATAYPDIMVSPTVVIILGTVILFFGMAEVVVDILYFNDHVQQNGSIISASKF